VVRSPIVLAEIAQRAVSEVFQSHQIEFRLARAGELLNGRRAAAPFSGPSATGLIQLEVEDGILAAICPPGELREDMLVELTNMLAGHLESEFLFRGLGIRYTTPRSVTDSGLTPFDHGKDGAVCMFEGAAGRVSVSIQLNLAPGAMVETLPTRRLPERGASKPNLRAGMPRSGHVLVVDDSATARAGFVTALLAGGFEVLEADSGLEALRLLRARSDIRLVLTDLHMSGVQGVDLIRMIKADEKLAGIPIVVLTASPAAIFEVNTAHIVTCLIKPISPVALIAVARRALG
jgi:two-component system chemotaxis response regulator CheY